MAQEVTLGVITEQGDLGLGFNQVTPEEQTIVENNEAPKRKPGRPKKSETAEAEVKE